MNNGNLANKVPFSEGLHSLNSLFDDYLQDLPTKIRKFIVEFLPKILTYEEEEQRIHPSLLIGVNLEENFDFEIHAKIIEMFEGDSNCEDISSNIKALMCICMDDWTVFINYKTDSNKIIYGILGFFPPITVHRSMDLFFDCPRNVKMIHFSTLSNFEILVRIPNLSSLVIDIRFENYEKNSTTESIIDCLVQDCITKCESINIRQADINKNYNNPIEVMLKGIFSSLVTKLHGTILVIIDANTELDKIRILKNDCKKILEPIDIVTYAKPLLSSNLISTVDVKRYFAITNLLVRLMNIDGICVIDNSLKIRAFNVFVNEKKTLRKSKEKIRGGARTRAFYAIINSNESGIIGCYFQSQDNTKKYWSTNFNANEVIESE